MYKIDSSIPIPAREPGRGRPLIYPLGDMKVGDSICETDAAKFTSLRDAISKYGRTYHMQFTTETRMEKKDGNALSVNVLRAWRTK
jgi:hypothetical protein